MIAIHTKYLPVTNNRGSRIKAYSSDGRSVTIPYPHELSSEIAHFEAVKLFVSKHLKYPPSLEDMRYGDTADGKGYVFCFADSIVGKQNESR